MGLIPEPSEYAAFPAYIEEQYAHHPLQKEADKETVYWFCFGLDENWEIDVPLQDRIDEEIAIANNRAIDDESLEVTVIT